LEDERALTMVDVSSSEEERWVTTGLDPFGRVIVVVYTWRGQRVRLTNFSLRRYGSREAIV